MMRNASIKWNATRILYVKDSRYLYGVKKNWKFKKGDFDDYADLMVFDLINNKSYVYEKYLHPYYECCGEIFNGNKLLWFGNGISITERVNYPISKTKNEARKNLQNNKYFRDSTKGVFIEDTIKNFYTGGKDYIASYQDNSIKIYKFGNRKSNKQKAKYGFDNLQYVENKTKELSLINQILLPNSNNIGSSNQDYISTMYTKLEVVCKHRGQIFFHSV